MIRIYLFRWWRHWQLDVGWPDRQWLSIGLEWKNGLRPILYLSPDATPQRATFWLALPYADRHREKP